MYIHRTRRPLFTIPALGIWGFVLLPFSGFCLLTSKFSSPLPTVMVPQTTNMNCPPPGKVLLISLDAQNRCYLSVEGQETQTAVIKAVAQQHGIRFTPAQLHKMQRLPFISQDIHRLPAWLSASAAEQYAFPKGIPAPQLRQYLTIGKATGVALTMKPLFIALRADESLSAKHVMAMVELIVATGHRRINFITNYQENKR
ncbi:hypothetical protein LRS06_03830 [Hymenobacter sp. J193]|uniref:hypothetical protein n=1 Tax=Hymenobacter sp. J193 TaxID=2898429 RepID=UPI0021510EDF|nr:hypothetical protein [Hymenobacter sp. J193]MCR5886918.1 hypothetical protein [Hymenobacter sp. J193]